VTILTQAGDSNHSLTEVSSHMCAELAPSPWACPGRKPDRTYETLKTGLGGAQMDSNQRLI
jgi:hypothetical protein